MNLKWFGFWNEQQMVGSEHYRHQFKSIKIILNIFKIFLNCCYNYCVIDGCNIQKYKTNLKKLRILKCCYI